ncbi:MAG: serine/threonine protein kinase [Planctomycetaceae bacterium]|nr:serine/threonine protein kinase [Planctomycetaceae bacterium]
MPTAKLTDGRTVDYLTPHIGEGGMKRVYFTTDKKSVVCFFKDKSTGQDPNRMERLKAILEKYNPTLDTKTGNELAELYCWPTGIITSPELGVMTPTYASNFFFASGRFKGKDKEGKWFSSEKLRKLLPDDERGNWLGYLQLCMKMARAIRKMHLTGLAHSDLSSKNVLVDPKGGNCAVIDIDSLVVPRRFAPDVLGTPGYIAPEVLATQRLPVGDPNRKLPEISTDLHALPVLIYEYLLRRHPLRGPKVNSVDSAEEDEFLSMGPKALFIEHPTDKSNRPREGIKVPVDTLGPTGGINDRLYLPGLFRQAFVDGLHNPPRRPTAQMWEQALYRTADLLIPCGNGSCPEKWFVYIEGQSQQCPWCNWKLNEPLPVLDFMFAPRKGQYREEGHCLVGFNQRPLNLWHVNRGIYPTEGVDRTTQAYVAKHQGQWILINKHLDTMISPSGNPVPKGQACVLKEGSEILLSNDDKGRMVSIRMVR